MINTEHPGIDDIVKMIEMDLPGSRWIVGNCPCGSPKGAYFAVIHSKDFDEGTTVGVTLSFDGTMTPITQGGSGWKSGEHGHTVQEALGNTYAAGIERENGE